jgi:hypothetical protein
MTDNQLLFYAAKAAGIDYSLRGQVPTRFDGKDFIVWNPLEHDGDALRLAVKLHMRVEINQRSSVVYWIADESEKSVYEYPDSIQNADYEIQHTNQDKATRRAIVRAAAIGEMK